MNTVRKGLIASLTFLASCTAAEAPVVTPVRQPTSIESVATQPPEPTAPAEPTAVPQPTAPAELTTESPTPESSSAGPETGSVAIAEPEDVSTLTTLPAFIEPPASLTGLVGTADRGELEEDRIQEAGVVGGGAIINTGDNNLEWRGLAWRTDGDQVSMAISRLVVETENGNPLWLVESAWLLQLPPDSDITLGNDVCIAAEPTHDYGKELFFVVTNKAQDAALGAWIITTKGPVEYDAFADLDCERFFP